MKCGAIKALSLTAATAGKLSPMAIVVGLAALICSPAAAQVSDDIVKIGVLTDMSGPYSDLNGRGVVAAAEMAAEDFGGKVLGKPIVIIGADHQHKPDIGTAIARRWIENEQVDVLADVTNSSIALAVQDITRQANRIALFTSPTTTELTGKRCSPTGFQWVNDNYSNAVSPVKALVSLGKKKWFFIVADFAFGHSMEKIARKTLEEAGGKVLGTVYHPLGTADFSSFLLTAQSSGAEVVLLASSGTDVATTIKQANEFGITARGQSIAALSMYITDLHSIGLEGTQGLSYVEGFYWDRTKETREFSQRFAKRHKGWMPTSIQAGMYSAVSHYLKAVQAAGTDEAKAVAAKMREIPVNDMFAQGGTVREDGRMVHDMYLVKVKSPKESKYPWDYAEIMETIPGEQAFIKLADSECPLVKR